MQQWILTSKDIDLLKNKIKFSYTRQCDTKYGEYTTTQSNNIVSLYSLTVRINICEEAAYTQSLTDIVDQLLIHEIGHHLYYFHDTNPQSFENICRKDGTSNCFEKDFVSGYAQGSAKEDYAETFYNFYTTISQQTLSTSWDKLGDKVNYFRKNYTIK